MSASTGNYEYLLRKIDEFIRKYYLNKVIRGSIYLAAGLFTSFVLVTLAEYYGNFSPTLRTGLFYLFIAVNLAVFIFLIAVPLSSYFKLGKTISYQQASVIIGEHFSHVKDKLLNTLQLKKLAEENQEQRLLIQASIDQKIAELRPVPFTSAVKISENRNYLKYALAPLLVILLITFTAPSIFSESTIRLIQHNKKFVKKAPFQFILLNDSLSAVEGEDYELKVKLRGNEIPDNLYLEDGPNTYKLDKVNKITFSYRFSNLQDTKKFRLQGGEYFSEDYLLTVRKKPTLLSLNVSLHYPAYLHKKDEQIDNAGDLTVPAGTQISWEIRTQNASQVSMAIGGKKTLLKPSAANSFRYSYRALANAGYSLFPVSREVNRTDSLEYQLTVIPDMPPAIDVTERPDSSNVKVLYFIGSVRDDHGFSRLLFHYDITDESRPGNRSSHAIPVTFDKSGTQSSFMHMWDLKRSNIQQGQAVEYYFEIWDNDRVNGPKYTRSATHTYRLPARQEMEKAIDSTAQVVKQKMDEAVSHADELEKGAKQLSQDLLSKKDLSYEDKKQIESLLQKQNKLEELVNEIKQDNKKNFLDRQDLGETPEKLLEKHKQLEDLLNNLLDEKTKELLKNIQQLLAQNNKSQTRQELSKMQMDNRNLKKELDRIRELYQQLEFDQKFTETVNKLDSLADQQKQLSEQSLKKNVNVQQLAERQNELKKSFKQIQGDLKELQEKNELLDNKNNYENPLQEQKDIEKEQTKADNNIEHKELKQASENQQNASQKMQQLAQKLQQMQEQDEQQENQINMQALREILKNLLNSSFQQEKLVKSGLELRRNDPAYADVLKEQKDIKDNLGMIRDSLYALSKKVPQIESFVNKEVATADYNVGKALENLAERRGLEASRNQQQVMTSFNNLALMLSEVLEQLQKSMKNSQGGKGKQKSLAQVRKMQEQLNQNMQKARQEMEKQGQSGQKPQQQQQQMSAELASLVREQQMIRQALQKINRELNKDGQGKLGNLGQVTKQMEQTETDLVNKRIRQETILRQQEILTKLLDAEKAEREREADKQRESKEGKDQAPDYRIVLKQYQQIKEKQLEILKTIPPTLNSFYKIKVGDYLKFLNSGN